MPKQNNSKSDQTRSDSVHHFQVDPMEDVDTIDAAKWAWNRIQRAAKVYCEVHCAPHGCSIFSLESRKCDKEDLGSEEWNNISVELHEAFAALPDLADSESDCPACAVLHALDQFPTIAKHSEVYPIATVRLNAVDAYPEVAFQGGIQSFSYPCHIKRTLFPDDMEQTEEVIRAEVLIGLDIAELPPMPPSAMKHLRELFLPGQVIAKEVHRLAHLSPEELPPFNDNRFDDNIDNAIATMMALKELYMIQIEYPDAIDTSETEQLHEHLEALFDLYTDSKGFKRLKEGYKGLNLNDSAGSLGRIIGLQMLFSMWHPVARTPKEGVDVSQQLEQAIQNAQEKADKPLKDIIDRLIEIEILDCRVPTGNEDSPYRDPLRHLYLLEKYWEILRVLIHGEKDSYIGSRPHPLARNIINCKERIEICFKKLVGFDGLEEARESCDTLIVTLMSNDVDELSVVPEWTLGHISTVDEFIENARLKHRTKRYKLTGPEKKFLDIFELGIERYLDEMKREWKRMYNSIPVAAEKPSKDQFPTERTSTVQTSPVTLEVVGEQTNKRSSIRVSGTSYQLADRNFELLMRLAVGRKTNADGWVNLSDLNLPINGETQAISRLREKLPPINDSSFNWIENNGRKQYRIALEPDFIRFEMETLNDHSSSFIQELIAQLQ